MSFTICILIVTTSVRLVAGSNLIYETLFKRHDVANITGISPIELSDIAEQVQQYVGGKKKELNLEAYVYGEKTELFTISEKSHMQDVQQLFMHTYQIQMYSFWALLLVLAIASIKLQKRLFREVKLWFQFGSLLCSVVIIGLGLASLVIFSQLFELFHMVGFPQGNYKFNSNTSFLVQLFPLGFWRDITLIIGVISVLKSASVLLMIYFLRKYFTEKSYTRLV